MKIFHVTVISEKTNEEVLHAVVAAENNQEAAIVMYEARLVDCDVHGDTRERIYLLGFGADGLDKGVIVHDFKPIGLSSSLN